MTVTELTKELAYRREERLALMGYYTDEETPECAFVVASKEAAAWAMANHHETYLQLINTK